MKRQYIVYGSCILAYSCRVNCDTFNKVGVVIGPSHKTCSHSESISSVCMLPESATVSRPPIWVVFPQAKASTSMPDAICPEMRDCLSQELQIPDSGLDEWWDSLSSPLSFSESLPLPVNTKLFMWNLLIQTKLMSCNCSHYICTGTLVHGTWLLKLAQTQLILNSQGLHWDFENMHWMSEEFIDQ